MTTTYFNSAPPIDHVVLVERFQSGEFDVFNEIVNRCRERVYNLAYRFTHNAEDSFEALAYRAFQTLLCVPADHSQLQQQKFHRQNPVRKNFR